jgi:FtsP/CotA-like multicopper oxidase with cupredoxin domain
MTHARRSSSWWHGPPANRAGSRRELTTPATGFAAERSQRSILGDSVPRPAESWESGRKDTVIAYPNEVTRVKALFDRPGLFVWHCHIVEHEDNR